MGCHCSSEPNHFQENNKEKDLTANLKINTSNSNNFSNFPITNSYVPQDVQTTTPQYPKSLLPKQDPFPTQTTKSTFTKITNDSKFNSFKHYCQEINPYSSSNLPESPSSKIHSLNYALFTEINSIRTNPKSYILKLAKYLNNIIIKDNKYLFNIGNEIYISLQSGYKSFEDAIAFLSSAKNVEPLEYVNELKINFEVEDDKLMEPQGDGVTSLEFIRNALMKKKEEVKGTYDVVGFHYDKSTDCAEVSAMLQVVDDTGSNYVRRNNIMNGKVKCVGISSCCIRENVYCFYLVFGNKKREST